MSPEVSIHAPTKGATVPDKYIPLILGGFNPRSHEGSDGAQRCSAKSGLCFNPRSHEGSDFNMLLSKRPVRSFNPRSHEGSDVELGGHRLVIKVSIHAPTKGATTSTFPRLLPELFQSTLPRRERRIDKFCRQVDICFNPRSHEGSDAEKSGVNIRQIQFQSTLPRRERLSRSSVLMPRESFNPRSHEGSDFVSWNVQYCEWVSIHAPTKGATSVTYIYLPSVHVSIHAPTKGATWNLSA